MIKAGSKVGFADITDCHRSFYITLGLQRLSTLCGVPRLSAGSPTTSPGWFRPQHETEVLSLVHWADFMIALRELAWAYQRRTPSFKALPLRDLKLSLEWINRLAFVSQVTRDYRVAGLTVSVPAEAAVFEDRPSRSCPPAASSSSIKCYRMLWRSWPVRCGSPMRDRWQRRSCRCCCAGRTRTF